MLSLAFHYCYSCRSSSRVNLFDSQRRRPCIGLCGHSICLDCVETNPNRNCPICQEERAFINKTVNYSSLYLIEKFSENYWEVMKNWWSGTGFEKGSCSKCSSQSSVLRLCLNCDTNNLCEIRRGLYRLRLRREIDLLNLATQVICSDCVVDHHYGHQTLKLQDFAYYEEDLRMATSEIILLLFRDWMKKKEVSVGCKLRHIRIELTGRGLWKAFENTSRAKEGQCGWLLEQIKANYIMKGIANLDRQLQDLFQVSTDENFKCECTQIYEALKRIGYQSPGGMEYDFQLLAIRCDESEKLGCPLYFEPNEKHYKKMLEITGLSASVPIDHYISLTDYENNCPLCALKDFTDTKRKRFEFYQNKCLDIYDSWWKSEMQPLDLFCFRCLTFLNHFRVGMSCKQREAKKRRAEMRRTRIRIMMNDRDSDDEGCDNPNCVMMESRFWKYAIQQESIGYPSRMLHENIELAEGVVNCKLRKMRILRTYHVLSNFVHTFSTENVSIWSDEKCQENSEKVDHLIEILKSQWNDFRFGLEGDTREPGSKCECTILWEREGEIVMRLYSKIAEYSPALPAIGCPLRFDHGVNIEEFLMSTSVARISI